LITAQAMALYLLASAGNRNFLLDIIRQCDKIPIGIFFGHLDIKFILVSALATAWLSVGMRVRPRSAVRAPRSAALNMLEMDK
jgi:hypothetical protein